MKELLSNILKKIFSARFLMAVIFTISYCLIEFGCVYITYKKIMSVDVFIAQLATFTVIVKGIAEDYFGRDDRGGNGAK